MLNTITIGCFQNVHVVKSLSKTYSHFYRDEVRAIGMSDFEALSNWLGSKPYMMGASPCSLDCSAFGFLAIFFYIFPETYYLWKETEEKYPNLKAYTQRMRETFWADWDELLAKD